VVDVSNVEEFADDAALFTQGIGSPVPGGSSLSLSASAGLSPLPSHSGDLHISEAALQALLRRPASLDLTGGDADALTGIQQVRCCC
jgi:hypothetical protein